VSQYLSTCTFCGVGCGIYLETEGNRIVGVYPSVSHPANRGRICVRGWHVHEVASAPDRLTRPLIRRNGRLTPVSMDEAYGFIAENLALIRQKHGPDAIGFLDSSRCSNEDGYLFQKFARAVIGTNNVDQGTSFYRTTTVDVLRKMLGIPAATNPINDLFGSGVVIVNEIDIGNQLPTIGGAIIRAHAEGTKVIVVGQRRHRVVEHADIFLNIKPATEVYLYAAMAKIIIDRGLADIGFIRSRCNGYKGFLEHIHAFDILNAARHCDINPAIIEEAALMFAQHAPGMIMYSAGSEEIGAFTINAMVDLLLLTGNIGRSGGGIMPLSEHNNSQGGCDMGVMPSYYPGYVPVSDAAGRARLEKAWGCTLSERPGLNAAGMFSRQTPIRAIWLDRHNPVVSAEYRDAAEVLQSLEFVVLQNLFMTKTAEHAHVVLPVAAFGEEAVTFTSTERRIQRAVRAVDPPADLPSAWRQIAEVAARMGAPWNYPTAADVLAEIASVVRDYGAVTAENLESDYGRQWPCTPDHPGGTPVLFSEEKPGRRFFFVNPDFTSSEKAATAEYPFALLFGHSLYYWHQNTLIRHSETLKREYGILLLDYPEGFVEINDQDAKRLSIRDGQPIRLVSGAGQADTFARVTEEVRPGIIFIPFFLRDAVRKICGQERSGGCAGIRVRIEKAG
jgi:formate dehydrogenase major subunit/formate dehydrogenase alpha subunit